MASYNKVILMGNLTRDPELRFLPSNMPVAQIGIAVNERFKNKQTDQWEDRPTFVDCEAFGTTAENIGKFFAKGRPILIEGKLRLDQWQDKESGQNRSKLKVIIDRFEFVGSRDDASGGGGGGGGGGGAAPRSAPQRSASSSARSPQSQPPPNDYQHDPIPEEDIPF